MTNPKGAIRLFLGAALCVCLSRATDAGQVTGVATDLEVTVPLAGVLVEAFAVDAVGNVAEDSFSSTNTLGNGSFVLPLGDVPRRLVLKFSQAGRTTVFIPNVSVNQASGALVIGAGESLNLTVIVPKKKDCTVAGTSHSGCGPRRCWRRCRCRGCW